jgi:hypothetical protein
MWLSINNQYLQALPDNIGNLHHLRNLSLSGNQLQSIPETIGDLQNLQWLNLSVNQLTNLTKRLSKLIQLELSVKNNSHLSLLPSGLHLRSLDISGCTRLTSLPDDIEILGSLELADSGLTSLPATLDQTKLYWHGSPADVRHVFHPETITAQEVVNEMNTGRRRILLERLGYAAFFAGVDAQVLDEEYEGDEVRRLLRYQFERWEAIVCLQQSNQAFMRVPDNTKTCQEAISWLSQNPGGYCPPYVRYG